jgi:hypothetical protein
MEDFPEVAVVGGLQNNWRSSADAIYKNWLQYVASKRADVSAFPAMATADPQASRKRSALL